MPQTLFWRDFKSGWIPSDDAIAGRKDGLLQMDNLELDKNGALSLAGGTQVVHTFSSPAHTLYSRSVNGLSLDYAAHKDGTITRETSVIATGGDSQNGAFATAFDFILATSGSKRVKDNGSTTVPLGINPPGVALTYFGVNSYTSQPTMQLSDAAISVVGGGVNGSTTGANSLINMQCQSSTQLLSVLQTHHISNAPLNWAQTKDLASSAVSPATDLDIFTFVINDGMTIPPGAIVGISIDILLVQPNGSGDVVSDYYKHSWDLSNLGQSNAITCLRQDFQRIGSGSQDWNNVYGFRITLVTTIASVALINRCGNNGDASQFGFTGGNASSLQGVYEYAQINVNNTGSYLAKSTLSLLSPPMTLNMNYTTVSCRPPSSDDPQANEAWVFRRGGNLDQWYRVLLFNSSTGFVLPQKDLMSDQDAIDLDITIDLNLVSIAATTIKDKIYDIIGPIEGRWYYFTTQFMYPSDINDPDLVNPGEAVRTTGSKSEVFLWARRVSDSAVVVGTSVDAYLVTGTYQTLPDGTIDIYYRSLGLKYPPITYDATVFEGSVFYLAADGWRLITPASFSTTYGGGPNQLLTTPNTDRLYRDISCYGYTPPNLHIQPGSTRFPVVIAKNKLWCGITGTQRIEVYDFTRKYWRVVKYGKGDLTAITVTQDGEILGCFTDNKLRVIDNQVGGLLIDGATKQIVNLLSPVFEGALEQPSPRNRKDLYTLKVKLENVSQSLTVSLIDDVQTTHVLGTIFGSFSGEIEQHLDISQVLPISKSFQIVATGSFSSLTITDFSIDFDTRPTPLTFLRLYNNNFGTASKKRVRVWPQVIDTLGSQVLFTPFVDGVIQPTTQIITSDKRTVNTFFKTDVFGVDYGATLYDPSGLMEYWGALDPDIVQVLPIARQFDQVGPQELFRYGRIKQFEIRVLPLGNAIPFNIYFNDNTQVTGSIAVISGIEASYFIGVPKGTAGSIVRIELGPTSFDFHRFYMRLQVMKSGADTELEWVTLPGPEAS